MVSPFVVSPVMHTDIPGGGQLVPMVVADRIPTNNDRLDNGYLWLAQLPASSGAMYYQAGFQSGLPNWTIISNISGPLNTLSDTVGTLVAPVGSNIQLQGTGGQIVITAGIGELVFTLPAAMIVPGSLTTTTFLTVGTDLTVVGTATVGTLSLTDLTTTGNVDLSSGGAGGQTIAIGNSTGASSIDMLVGTGNFTLNGAATSTYTIGAATTTGTITIGGTAQTGALSIGTSTGAMTLNLATGNGAKTVNMATGTGGNTVNINTGINAAANTVNIATGAAADNSTVSILSGAASAGTQTLNLNTGTGAVTRNTNIGTGAAVVNGINIGGTGANVIAIGNTQTAGSIAMSGAMTTGTFTVGSTTMTGAIVIGQSTSGQNVSISDAAPTASRTTTIAGGTVVTAAVTDTLDLGPDGATTNANSIKTVNVNTGGVTLGQVLTNIATGAVTSGTHTTAIATGNRAAGTMALNLMTGTGTKTLSAGNADAGTTINLLGTTNVNTNVNANVAINTGTSTGTVSIGNAAAGAMTMDTAAGISLDAATASNFTVTGAGADLTLASVGGSVLVSSTEDAALAIRLHANGGTSETIQLHADQGTGVGSINLLSDVGGITFTATGLASADAINLEATAGGIDVDAALQINITSTQNAADAIRILATAGGIDIDATGAAGEDISIVNTGGSIVLQATENAADSIVINSTVGGIDITCSAAGAGEDIDIVNTGGSVNITATESIASAIVLTASTGAGGITMTSGTSPIVMTAGVGGISLQSGLIHKVTSVATAASPYSVLGTDYFITTDTTAGALTVTLPAAPETGRCFVVYDGAGQAAAGGNITIDGNGNNIAAGGTSAATKLINTAYESYILTYTGTIWAGQNIV